MKRALTLLSLILFCACASNDGFIQKPAEECGSGAEVGIAAGWSASTSGAERGTNRLLMMVEVANNSDHEITVKRVFIDPGFANDNSPWTLERGAIQPGKVIAEGEASTFEVPMTANYRFDRRGMGGSTSADVTVTVVVEPEASYRCRFRVPMPS